MSRRLLAAVLLVAFGFPSLTFAQSDHDRIQGTWTVLSAGDNGIALAADRVKCMLVKIDDKRIRIREASRRFAEVMLYELDSSKSPKWIDLICARESYGEPRILGIYSLEDDVLKLVWRRGGCGPRPADFVCRRHFDPPVTDMSVHFPLTARPVDLICPTNWYRYPELDKNKDGIIDRSPTGQAVVDKSRYRATECCNDEVMMFVLKKAEESLNVHEAGHVKGQGESKIQDENRGEKSLADDKDLPKVVPISDAMSTRWGRGTVAVPAPREVNAIMRRVPRGRLITINEIRTPIARKHGATIGCPITTGIFAWIAAHAADEAAKGRQADHALLANAQKPAARSI